MIFFFSYFWVATQFQPAQIADDLKKYGGYIPGRASGQTDCGFPRFHDDAADFCRRDFPHPDRGFAAVCSARDCMFRTITAQFFGGTSLLIIVGVMLDTMRQVETHLIQRHYDGFLRKGRIRGRAFDRASYSRGEAAAAGHTDVALRWHCRSGHRRRGDFPLRSLGEKTTRASRRARFRQRNPGGNDHAPVRYSGDFAGRDFAAREGSRHAARVGNGGDDSAWRTGSGQDHRGIDRRLAAPARRSRFCFRRISAHAAAGAKAWQTILKRLHTPLDLAIWLEVSEETVRDRIAGRLQCGGCGFTTSVTSAKFAERPVCPYCDGPLVRRNDDDAAFCKPTAGIQRQDAAAGCLLREDGALASDRWESRPRSGVSPTFRA